MTSNVSIFQPLSTPRTRRRVQTGAGSLALRWTRTAGGLRSRWTVQPVEDSVAA